MELHADLKLVINTVRVEIANGGGPAGDVLGIVDEYLAMLASFVEPNRAFERSHANVLAAARDLQRHAPRGDGRETELTAALRAQALRSVDALEAVATASQPSVKALRLGIAR